MNVGGNLARVDGTDADALGLEAIELVFEPRGEAGVSREHVEQALASIFDPEIPVNLLDLGLIYDVAIDAGVVTVIMTLTAPGCGMGPVLVDDVKYRVGKVPGVETVDGWSSFSTPWSREMMSEEAQLELGMGGLRWIVLCRPPPAVFTVDTLMPKEWFFTASPL